MIASYGGARYLVYFDGQALVTMELSSLVESSIHSPVDMAEERRCDLQNFPP